MTALCRTNKLNSIIIVIFFFLRFSLLAVRVTICFARQAVFWPRSWNNERCFSRKTVIDLLTIHVKEWRSLFFFLSNGDDCHNPSFFFVVLFHNSVLSSYNTDTGTSLTSLSLPQTVEITLNDGTKKSFSPLWAWRQNWRVWWVSKRGVFQKKKRRKKKLY